MKSFSSLVALGVMVGGAVVLSACGTTPEDTTSDTSIATGDTVSLSYTLTWSDGTVFASNVSGATVTGVPSRSLERNISDTVDAGDTTIFGSVVLGHALGDTLSGSVSPQESGNESFYTPNKIQKIDRSALGNSTIPTIGDMYEISGQQAYITEINNKDGDQEIVFDLNARETRDSYTYDVTITGVEK